MDGTPQSAEPRKPKVLIVDDDAFLSSIYETRLTQDGFEVIRALDGVEGLETAGREKPDVILLDVLMPRMDGFETLRNLKKDKGSALAKIPVLMLTSLGQREDVERGLQEGAADYLLKTQTLPTDASEKIRKVLAKM